MVRFMRESVEVLKHTCNDTQPTLVVDDGVNAGSLSIRSDK